MHSNDEADTDSHPRTAGRAKPFAGRRAVKRVRRKRDPPSTREAILVAARELFSQEGKGGLTFSQIAQRTSVNRTTAYQHCHTHEELIEATAVGVSIELYRAIFDDPAVAEANVGESTYITLGLSGDGKVYEEARVVLR